MSDLVARVTERLDELERVAEAATPGPWDCTWDSQVVAGYGSPFDGEQLADCFHVDPAADANATHIALNDPDQTKRLVAGLRAVVGFHEPRLMGWPTQTEWCVKCGVKSPCPTLAALASIWEVGS